jgi:mutual gliding-motility protein MglA
MSSINLHTREITIKVVYYGPGLGGKTSSLQYIHRALRPDLRGQLVSLATAVDRTLYFDFLPVKLPKVKDFTIRMSLYTVPGQVHYNSTRKLVLQGCDGVVFVADSQAARLDANMESIHNLDDNLRAHGMNPNTTPLVLQFNKRDLPEIMPISQMEEDLNPRKVPRFDTCALSGIGIFEALKTVTKLVLTDLKRKGIYQDKPVRAAPKTERAPVVNPSVEESLVRALEFSAEGSVGPSPQEPAPLVSGRGLTFSELWPPTSTREQILAMEGEIERGDHLAAVRRAESLLRDYGGHSEGPGLTTAEALLMIGVHGAHYARFREILAKVEPTKKDALFCLFFLADIELRMQGSSIRIEE